MPPRTPLASVRHPESLLFYEELDTVPPQPWQQPWCSRQQPLSTRRRRPRCRGEGWVAFGTSLQSRSCPSGRGRGSGPGRPRGSAVLQHLGQAGALRAAGALPCPLLPTTANPTGSTAT